VDISYELSYPSFAPRRENGRIFVFSGPSGIGKTHTIDNIVKKAKNNKLKIKRAIPVATRDRRENEVEGEYCRFISNKEFLYRVRNGEFLEASIILDKGYGTPLYEVFDRVNNGIDVIIDVGYEGIKDIINREKLQGIYKIFILLKPYGGRIRDELASIITKRQPYINEAELKNRIDRCQEDIAEWEKNKKEQEDNNNPNVKFISFEYDIEDDDKKERDYVQSQILHYVLAQHKRDRNLSNKKTYDETKAFKYFYEAVREEKDKMWRVMEKEIPVNICKDGLYLDIGAGTGHFTKRLIDYFKPQKVYIVEPAHHLISSSSFGSGIRPELIKKSWESALKEEFKGLKGGINLITSFNVNYEDWEFSLEKLYRFLDNKGVLVVSAVDPVCEYAETTVEIKRILDIKQQEDLKIKELESKIQQFFTFKRFSIKVDVKFAISNNEKDRYVFKFMFGKWVDEIDETEWKHIEKELDRYYNVDTALYCLPAKHFVFLCNKLDT
jgi:guanylate kinase